MIKCPPLFLLSFFLLLFIDASAQYEVDTIFFSTGSYSISTEELFKLNKIPKGKVSLEGRTDAKGNYNYNLKLSKQRVQSVKKLLLKKGHAKNELITAFYGELNADEFLNPLKNRCVIIKYEVKKKVPTVPFSELVEGEEFDFKNSEGLKVTLDNGVKIDIQPNSFQGRASDKVVFNVRSYMTKSDFILANLQSMAGDRLLESAGMFKLEAKVNDRPTKLRTGKTIDMQIPNKERKPGFKLFNGVHDNPHHGEDAGSVDWVVNWANTSRFNRRGSMKIEGTKKEYGINTMGENRWRLSTRNFQHKSKYFKISRYKLRKAINTQRTPVVFKVHLKLNEGLIEQDSIEIVSGELRTRVRRSIAKVLKTADWKKRKKGIALVLTFDYGSLYNSVGGLSKSELENIDTDTASLDLVMLKVTNIGWINCDRFTGEDNLKRVAMKGDTEATVKLIFKNFNSLINGVYLKGTYDFGSIPEYEPFNILSYKEEGNDVLVAVSNNTNYKEPMEYEKMTRDDFVEMLKTF